MKHHSVGRPVGKCKGCCLNMRTSCAAGVDPKFSWEKGRCKSMDDRALLAVFMNPLPATGAKAAKLERKARAVLAAAQPHYNGRHSLGRSAASAR